MLAALAFLTSPLGRIVAGAALLAALYAGGFAHGYHMADKGAEIAALKSQLAAKDQDARIANQLRAEVQAKAERLQENEAAVSQQVNDYETAISKLTEQARVCRRASSDDIKRLRDIR